MTNTFTVNEKVYSHKKLDAFTQLFISRKTAPLFVDLQKGDVTYADALSNLNEEDFDTVLKKIMPFIERQDVTGNWAPIYSAKGGVFVYDDITGGEILEILFAILMEYIPDFYLAVDHVVFGTPQETPTKNTQAQNTTS